jgi:Ubiquinone biosynthesis protein COQ7
MGGSHRASLVRQLQRAYSGELAAAYAYRGHWRATRDPVDRARIRTIEEEEWHHRRGVGEMLRSLGARCRIALEVRAWVIGRALGLLCFVAGRFLPMYGAGKLESRNVGEYEVAARHAMGCDRADLVEPLSAMAEVEWDHEAYFRSRVAGHAALRWFPLWPAPTRVSGRRREPAGR